jgi:hypothetical protein
VRKTLPEAAGKKRAAAAPGKTDENKGGQSDGGNSGNENGTACRRVALLK